MDLETTLLEKHSKEQMLLIRDYVGNNKERFDELIQLFLQGEYRITQRASWAMIHCVDAHVELIMPYIETLFQNLRREGLHDSIKRNTLRVLQKVDLPEEVLGEAADICFGYLANPKEAVAIRVFSMSVLWNICQQVPELASELKMVIEEFMPYGSAGFKSRGKKILKAIHKKGF